MKKKLLMIDDDIALCEEYQEILESEGYSVSIEHNGLVGKTTLEEKSFDALILDIKIPGLNGFQILEWLTKQKYKMRILVLTGRPLGKAVLQEDANIEEENLLLFANEVMNKPLKIEKLITIVGSLMSMVS